MYKRKEFIPIQAYEYEYGLRLITVEIKVYNIQQTIL